MKPKIFTSFILGIMLLAAPMSRSQNILTDGEFTTTTVINSYFDQPAPDNVWHAWQNWQINNSVTVVGGVCNFQITTLGAQKNTWDIQLVQKGFSLALGHTYRLSFDVKADGNRTFGLFLGENGGLWTSLIGYDNYNQFATTDWKTKTIDFMASSVFPNLKLSFELGAEQISTYFDNIKLEDMGPIKSIGIIGTSVNGWNSDVDMQTTDGIKYSLFNFPLNVGELKFRQDNNWTLNWGSNTFPSGIGIQDGLNIPIPSFGNYDITFNRVTGEYSFVATTCPIAGIECPDPVYMLNSPGICGAQVYYPPVVAAANCGGEGITIVQTDGLPSGSLFPVGITTNTFVLTNTSGNTATCSFDVTVLDIEPPVITGIADQLEPLWPPNHKMVPIKLNYATTDNCGGKITNEIFVTSNEPDNGLGDGDQAVDWKIVDDHNILLRAERSGKGKGRLYYIYLKSHDESLNYSNKLITVAVPHDKGDKPIVTIRPPKNHKSAIIGDESASFSTKIWPNSSRNSFNLEVQSASNEKVVLSVFDSNGRMISNQNIDSKQTTSFGENLRTGIYMVMVRQGNNFESLKVVKQ